MRTWPLVLTHAQLGELQAQGFMCNAAEGHDYVLAGELQDFSGSGFVWPATVRRMERPFRIYTERAERSGM